MSEARAAPFSVSVIVVSDYEEAAEKTWHEERRILRGLADQDFREPFTVILVENHNARNPSADELHEIFPHLLIVFSAESQSAKLKDIGVMKTQTEYVAVFEADSVPERQWLSAAVDVLRQRADVSIVSGRTTYGNESMYRRCLGLLDRSFDDLGLAGETRYVSNNAALYRRASLTRFPYPEAITPFLSARMRMKEMHESGIRLWFDPKVVARHAIGGWRFISDFRRNMGYSDMAERGHQAASQILPLVWHRLKIQCSEIRRMGPRYLKWYDWPLLFVLLPCALLLEIPGMLDALKRRERIPHSAYR